MLSFARDLRPDGPRDAQGIAPVGYALFAVALGLAAGAIMRRVLPALATTLGLFVALRIVIANLLRPHYLHALRLTQRVGATAVPKGAYWQLTTGIRGASGTTVPRIENALIELGNFSLSTAAVPAACRRFAGDAHPQGMVPCLNAHGYRQFLTYQPASHYWPFQFIETGVFAALAAALIAVTFAIVRRRDA
jgi:hypothetical protein